MSRRRRRHERSHLPWDAACDHLAGLLTGGARGEILDAVLRTGDFGAALRRLRSELRTHLFTGTLDRWCLEGIVRRFDALTRRDGFHVLLEWDGRAHRFVKEPIPVLLLDYVAGRRPRAGAERHTLAVLLDYYFLYVLALVLTRAWDEGDPNRNLERVAELLAALRGPGGSGLRLVDEAATLLFVAISHYEPDDGAYDRLLEKVRGLDEAWRLRVALVGAPVLGSHLRWGFEAYYRRELRLMREDNVADYPWLIFCLSVLHDAWLRLREAGVEGEARERVVGALLNGLTADPRAFMGRPPASLAALGGEHARFRERFEDHRVELLEEFELHRPREAVYSPLAFRFNFPHNVVMPLATLSMLHGTAPNLPLDALLTREPEGTPLGESREVLARLLMDFSGSSPERLGERKVVMIGYHTRAALESYTRTLNVLGGGAAARRGRRTLLHPSHLPAKVGDARRPPQDPRRPEDPRPPDAPLHEGRPP